MLQPIPSHSTLLGPRSEFMNCPRCGVAHLLCETCGIAPAPKRWPFVVGLSLSVGIAAALMFLFGKW
jgi:hypothetical protein